MPGEPNNPMYVHLLNIGFDKLTREWHMRNWGAPRRRISIPGRSCSHRATEYDPGRLSGLLFQYAYKMLGVGSAWDQLAHLVGCTQPPMGCSYILWRFVPTATLCGPENPYGPRRQHTPLGYRSASLDFDTRG